MNIVNSGNKFTVYGEEVQTYKELPVNTYKVCFSPMFGFSLIIHDDMSTSEKIYGDTLKRAQKVLHTFEAFDRNMGVILSGIKGAGKSLFARVLAEQGREKGLPMIIVDSAYNGLSDFLTSIKQECIVLFDEFEKTFDDEEGEQDSLLSLFDGVDNGKKLFIVTCNNYAALSEYFLNRPGRFHYHFTFGALDIKEITQYLEDNLIDAAKKYIPDIIRASVASEFTYDILRAVVFELNNGYDLTETLRDLNIERVPYMNFTFELEFDNGVKAIQQYKSAGINMDSTRQIVDLSLITETLPKKFRNAELEDVDIRMIFNPHNLQFSSDDITINPDMVSVDFNNSISDRDLRSQVSEWLENIEVTKITVRRVTDYTRKLV